MSKSTNAKRILPDLTKATPAKATPAKATPAKAKAEPKAKATKADANLISLVAIAKEIHLDPKKARAKARKSDAIKALSPDPTRWVFAPDKKAQVIAILTPKA